MTTRNQIYAALFALASTGEGLPGVAGFTWPGGGSLLWTSRRVRMWDSIPVKPALCQIEPMEDIKKVRGMPYSATLEAEWWFFHQAGVDETAIPTITNNDIVDTVQTILTAPAYTDKQTLGGLVYDCYVEGQIIKVAGDIEGQALITVPIKILVP